MNNTIEIIPSSLNGNIIAPPSKSFSHRAIICGALSGGICNIFSVFFSEDVLATINAMKKIGTNINLNKNSLKITKFNKINSNITINCIDSGSTLRFLIPIVSALNINTTFKLSLQLSKRPIIEYLEVLSKSGVKYEICKDLSVKISGKLKSGVFLMPGDISSQFISGLLMALPIIEGNSEIKLTSKLESYNYVDITIEVMKYFGVYVKKTNTGFLIKGNQKYISKNYTVESDWSQASVFMALGAINGNITIKNLNKNSSQGDKNIINLLSRFGADIKWNKKNLEIKKSILKGIKIDASNIPDLVPVLAVIGSYSESVTEINNLKRLKYKECNRLNAIYTELKKLEVDIKKLDDSLIIKGNTNYKGNINCWSHNDHRICMMLSVMATKLSKKLTILDADSINKSYPNFFEEYNKLGGIINGISMGR